MPKFQLHNSACVIVVEGVLQKLITTAPIAEGLQIYHGLSETFQILLVSDSDKETLDHWLQLENLNKHGIVIYNDGYLQNFSAEERRVKQIYEIRNRGYAIDLIVEPDPVVAAQLLYRGFSVLNFLHTAYSHPEWRPDFEEKVKPWSMLEEQVTKDIILRTGDKRMEQES